MHTKRSNDLNHWPVYPERSNDSVMNRTSFVVNMDPNSAGYLYPHFRNAFLACLSPEEICSALDLDFNQPPNLRQVILGQIRKNIIQNFLGCHEQLLETLLYLI